MNSTLPASPTWPKGSAATPSPWDAATCYQAFKDKDAAADGLFFMGVSSTRIYCRPVCRVRLPQFKNCHFFASAAQAEAAGFRPCLRCRPELAPAQRWWSTTDALALLAQAAAKRLDASLSRGEKPPAMTALAQHLGVSDRHLRRVFEQHWRVSPLQYLQTRRLLMAKQHLQDAHLSVTEVALSSGFGSVRRMNAAFAQHYRLTPSQWRARPNDSGQPGPAIRLSLAYRPPCQHGALWRFFKDRSLTGAESWSDAGPQASLRKTVQWAGSGQPPVMGWIELEWLNPAHHPVHHSVHQVQLTVSPSLRSALPELVPQVRAWLDLDADPAAIERVIGPDFAQSLGLRVPGTLDGFELAVRAILGQQISVPAARTLAQRLVDRWGEPCPTPWPELNRCFPTPAALTAPGAAEGMGQLGVLRQRQQAIQAVAHALLQGQLDLSPQADLKTTLAVLQSLPGVGAWTANYIAMRALRWPDAWLVQDAALQSALGVRQHAKPAQALGLIGQAWAPFRSYAVLAAWQQLADSAKDKT